MSLGAAMADTDNEKKTVRGEELALASSLTLDLSL